MRFIRMLFIILLATILVAIALANRGMVTLNLFPARLDQFIGGIWSVDLPLFLVIFLAVAFGMLMGLIWEYLREAQLRREAKRRSTEVARLEREIGNLRHKHASPSDEIVAVLDRPKSRPAARPIASAEPASGTTLPAPR